MACTFVPKAAVALLLAALLLAPLRAAEESKDDGPKFVIELNATNFDEVVSSHDFIVVDFYAKWCGHCKSLAPKWEHAAKMLADEGSHIKLAKIDADLKENRATAGRYKLNGFPTIRIFRNKSLTNDVLYSGEHKAVEIVTFLKKMLGPASEPIESPDQVSHSVESKDLAVVGIFKEAAGKEFETFMAVADLLRLDFHFYHTTDTSLLPKEYPAPSSLPVVRVYQAFNNGYEDIAEFDVSKLKAFIEAHAMPWVVEYSKDPAKQPLLGKMFQSDLKLVSLMIDYNGTDADKFKDNFIAFAKQKPEGFGFLMGDAQESKGHLRGFQLTLDDAPLIFCRDKKEDAKYYRTRITPDDVTDFLTKFIAGEEPQRIKSAPVPENNDGPIKIAVADNFNEVVFNTGRNVVLGLYTSKAAQGKKLENRWSQLREDFIDEPGLIFVKFDTALNELPNKAFKLEGIPTVYMLTSKGDIVHYEDADMMKKMLAKWIKATMTPVNYTAEELEQIAEEREKRAEAARRSAREEL